MRRKTSGIKPPLKGTRGYSVSFKTKETKTMKQIKQGGKQAKTPRGKGLGKAGAKRLGQLLKRAIQTQEEPQRGKISLPNTPVRLFKHQIQTKSDNALRADSTNVSQLILQVVAECKHKGGISMAELKKTLAAGGFDVTKNNSRVNELTTRLVNNETLVRTTRNSTFRINNKKLNETNQVIPPKSKEEQISNTSEEYDESPKQVIQKTKRKVHFEKDCLMKSHKVKGRTREAAAKSRNSRGKRSKGRSKPLQSALKKHKSAKKQAANPRKARKMNRTHQPKQISFGKTLPGKGTKRKRCF